MYRDQSIAYLQRHLNESNTVSLLYKPPTGRMKVSEHVRERTQKKAMTVMVFLKYMMDRDTDKSHFINVRKYAVDMSSAVGKLLDTNKTTICNAY